MRLGLPTCWIFASFFVGCGGATLDQLRSRAAFDLQCSSDEIEIVNIDDRTKGASGCGGRATYVESCRAGANGSLAKVDCTWVMNSEHAASSAGK